MSYTYDTNPVNGAYSSNAAGRLTTVTYSVPAYSTGTDAYGDTLNFAGDTVVEMYTYNKPGLITGKRMQVTRTDNYLNQLTANLDATWAFNNEGNLTGVIYPNSGPSYSYTYDGMGRLSGSGVGYNAASQLTSFFNSETRSYNVNGQLTNITVPGSLNLTYTYASAGLNNGKIASQTDNLSGETVTYAYDSLNRLISAQVGSTWGQGFNYDPFGNLAGKTVLAGSVPTLSLTVDATTNHLGGEDANGNATTTAVNETWDSENRLATLNTQHYAYDGSRHRIWACTATGTSPSSQCSTQVYYFYDQTGKLLAQFTPVYVPDYWMPSLAFANGPTRVYWGGRLLGTEDALGSRGKYYPYGEDRGSSNPANDNVKFATYTRDSATGVDYAGNRFYSSSAGRFLSADPYSASAGKANPQSWNRYAYAIGDPANGNDPAGLFVREFNGSTYAFGSISSSWPEAPMDFSPAAPVGFSPAMNFSQFPACHAPESAFDAYACPPPPPPPPPPPLRIIEVDVQATGDCYEFGRPPVEREVFYNAYYVLSDGSENLITSISAYASTISEQFENNHGYQGPLGVSKLNQPYPDEISVLLGPNFTADQYFSVSFTWNGTPQTWKKVLIKNYGATDFVNYNAISATRTSVSINGDTNFGVRGPNLCSVTTTPTRR